MKQILLTILAITLLFLNSAAQSYDKYWVLGDSVGIYWDSINVPHVYTVGVSGQLENFACISDSLGNLQYFLHGKSFMFDQKRSKIVNRLGETVPNGDNIISGNSLTQGAIFLPAPNRAHITYLFHISRDNNSPLHAGLF